MILIGCGVSVVNPMVTGRDTSVGRRTVWHHVTMVAKRFLLSTILTETTICIVEWWKESLGYCFVLRLIMHWKVIHLSFFFYIFFLRYLQDHSLLRSRNFATIPMWCSDFSLYRFSKRVSKMECYSLPTCRYPQNYFSVTLNVNQRFSPII